MHDASVIDQICKRVEELARRHNAISVTRIVLEVGDLSHFTPEHMKETFTLFRRTSRLLQDTELEFRQSFNESSQEIYLRDIELELEDENA